MDNLRTRSVGFASLSEAMNTTTPQGRLLFHLMGALAEFGRSLIVERTTAGRAAAVKRGVRFGPKPKLTDRDLRDAQEMLAETDTDGTMCYTFAAVANRICVYRVTLRRALNRKQRAA